MFLIFVLIRDAEDGVPPAREKRCCLLSSSAALFALAKLMGMMKNYLLNLLQQCSEEQFGQDAIEWALESGLVRLVYDLDRDVREIMSRYDEIIEAYRRSPAQATHRPTPQPAPMQRAVPGRRAKASDANPSIKKRHAA
jgi:hypothetical protein